MKDYFNLRKSTGWHRACPYIFALLAAFAGGVSPAWADAYTCGFGSSEGWTPIISPGEGWSIQGGAGDLTLSTNSNYYHNASPGLYWSDTGSNTTHYVISPKFAAGTIKFYARGRASSDSGSVKVYIATESGSSYTIGTTNLCASCNASTGDLSHSSWKEFSFTLTEDAHVAFLLYRSAIDDISAPAGLASTAPAGIGVYSDAEATAAVKDGVNLSWGLDETAQSQTYYIKNESGADWSNLAVSHTGNATLSSVSATLANNGVASLTISQATTGSTTDVITITAGDNLTFTINVSGTVKDNNHLFESFLSTEKPTDWTSTGTWSYSDTNGASNTTYYESNNYRLISPLVKVESGDVLYFDAMGTYSGYQGAKLEYSTDGTTWTAAPGTITLTSAWQTFAVTGIPAGNYYLAIHAWQARIRNFYGGKVSTAPVLSLSQSSWDFGLIDANKTSEAITITNTGKSALTGLNITSSNPNFTVAVTDNATTINAIDGTATFTVTMTPNVTGAQSATITIASDNADELTFTATGAVAKSGTTTETFNDGMPAAWTNSSSPSWSFSDGKAVAPSASWGTYATLTTPLLTVAGDDFLAIKVKANGSSYGHLKVFTSTDGTTFGSTALKEVSYTELSTEEYKTIIVTGLTTSVKAILFEGYQVTIDEISGLNYAPILSVTQGGAAVASPAAYPFGEISSNQTVTYNFTNIGGGTIYITNVESSNDVFTTNWTETVAASNYDLTITANYSAENAGEHNGTVTVTTSEGTFVITLTSTLLAANAPKFALLIGETEQTTGADLGFGIITADATKTFIIKNDGTGALNVTGIALPDADYSTDLESAPTAESPLVIAAGGSKTVNVTLAATAKAIKTGNIVISADGFDNFSFKADAYVMAGTTTVDFAGNALPTTWSSKGTWTYTTGAAYSTTNNETDLIISPKVVFNDNDFILLKAKGGDSSTSNFVSVRVSSDNGTTWSTLQKINQGTAFTNSDFSTIVVSGIPSTTNKIAFASYWVYIDDIAGLVYDANDPTIAVYSDAAATQTVTFGTAKDFGWSNTAKNETFYIKNNGTGTLTISNISASEGFTAATAGGAMTVAANAESPLELTVTMTAGEVGAKSGTVTLTTDGGNFEIPVSGFVYDAAKNLVDFTADGATWPAGWSHGDWTVSGNTAQAGQTYSTSSTTDIVTTKMIAAPGEKMIIEALSNYTSSNNYYANLSYSYSTDNKTWSDAVSLKSDLTGSYKLFTLDAFNNGEENINVYVKFSGNYVSIRRIYGLTAAIEPIMTTTAADIAFGMQTTESEEQTFTVSNEGTATLEGLTITLGKTGDDAEYAISSMKIGDNDFTSGSDLEAGKTVTVKVKQLFDINKLGTKSDVLTIAPTDQTPVTINLTGATRDGSKMYVDFADGVPATWTTTGTWTTSSGYAQAPYSGNATLTSPALTIAAGESLTVDLSKQYNNNSAVLTFRYTTDGGINWTEQDLNSDLTYGSFTTKTLSLGNTEAVTAFIQFVGTYYARIDNIYGGTVTNAPMIALGTSETLTDGKYDFGQNLQAAPADKTFTITNNGNADLVSTVTATGDVTAAISGDDVTIDGTQVTVPAGKTATIKISLTFDASQAGAKTGSVTIDSNDPVADITLNFTANVLDPTALYIDFSDNQMPAGWYNTSWTFTNGDARYVNYNTAADLITEQFEATAEKNQLSFDAWTTSTSSYVTKQLSVWTSTDRKNWTKQKDVELTTTPTTVTLDALATDKYYVKFSGSYCAVDNITGLAKVTGIEHDFYMANYTLPTETVVPGTEYEAKINVASLRADETDLTAAIWIQKEGWENATEVGRISDQTLSVADGAKEFTITGTLPNEEGKYWIWANIWHNTNGAAETDHLEINLAHTRTLEITEFTRTSDETADADANNEFEPTFTVTVKNTGTVDLAANQVSASILFGSAEGAAVLTATATESLAKEASVQLTLTGKVSAAAGGELNFYAKENLSNNTFATPQTVTVTAQAALFAINTDGSTQDFGVVKVGDEPVTKTFTVTNNGTKMLKVGFSAPEGYSYNVTEQHGTIVKFTNNANWGTVYLHAWKTEGETTTALTTWPGVQLTEGYSNEFNQTVYYAYVPENATGILFNNGNGTQTHDITGFADVEGYYSQDSWADGKLNVISYGENTMMALAAGTSGTFTVTLATENVGTKSGNVGLSTNAADTDWFEIPVTGRVIDASTWTENFDEATAFPMGWTGGTWTIGTNSNYNNTKMAIAPTSSTDGTMISPRLAANAGDVLSWTAYFNWYDEVITVEYSDDDQANWTQIYNYKANDDSSVGTTRNTSKDMSFTAPADGNYYLRFTSRYGNAVDNFVGFQLNLPEHIMAISSYSIPTSGSYSPSMKATKSFEATVTVKESRGVNEENVVAKFYMGEEVIGTSETVTVAANETKVISITATPTVAATTGAQMHIEVEYAGGTLNTADETRYVAEFISLALTETEEKEITTGYSAVYDQVTLTRSFTSNWNTFVAPVAVNLSDIHANAVAYSFTGYENGELTFTKVTATTLTAATPYIIYIPETIESKTFTWDSPVIYSSSVGADNIKTTKNGATFQGTYAPMAAGSMEGKYGITKEAKIAKGSASASMKGFRAYFELPDGASARIAFTDEANGITTVIAADELDGNAYDLQGRKMQNLKKGGLYIINGKKQVVK